MEEVGRAVRNEERPIINAFFVLMFNDFFKFSIVLSNYFISR